MNDSTQSQVGTEGGFVFRADNGEFYAVNADGEQSPSFKSREKAVVYLRSAPTPYATEVTDGT